MTNLDNIRVTPAPHVSKHHSTRTIMLDVIIGLAPAMFAAVWFFHERAAIIIAACVVSCVVTEWVCNKMRGKPNSIGDLSAVVTGIILALSVPARLPIWAAVIGSVFCIAIGKMVFGGLGSNIFNPAMVGRAFLTASFGMLMTTWSVPAGIAQGYGMDKMPKVSVQTSEELKQQGADETVVAITRATPLAWAKEAMKDAGVPASLLDKQAKYMVLGNTAGCLGETSTLALLIGGIYLLVRRTVSFHIPVAVLGSAFVFAAAAYMINKEAFINPVLHLTAGGLMICAFFIATDPVTAPLTVRGMWIFGIGVGLLVMLIRVVGEYPEGVMYAVLLMNGVTPLIDRFCRLAPAGGGKKND